MKLRVISSTSAGNAYALDAGDYILLLEAGVKYERMAKAIDFRTDKVVGCLLSHVHGDHARYAVDYAKQGIQIYGNADIKEKMDFPFGSYNVLSSEITYSLPHFCVVPFDNFHDVPIFGYIIRQKDMGTMLFSTDTYKIGFYVKGINHYLIEANYSDSQLKDNVWSGEITKAHADRVMLSHMSIDYCMRYLRECDVEKSVRTITLCHLSSKNSDPDLFQKLVMGAFSIPTYIAERGTVVELNKKII